MRPSAKPFTISNAAADQVRTALAKQQVAEKPRDDIDTKATKGKMHDLAENETLRRAVADGPRRLRIAGSCSANSGNVSSTASLGNGGVIELAPAAGQRCIASGVAYGKARTAKKNALQFRGRFFSDR
ncbi:lysis system i-spanin subunit Rz [Pseudomonas sp. 11/12A]|uniref:lysis system i-spanin subunit Rz n=1 Tax=Pseudomonas sp. 11/12A TaxID=1506582 RepID=UPI001F4873DD|nr:lysis system i-spanin subunit Rz [Pseudomonas sp. 11/12A]